MGDELQGVDGEVVGDAQVAVGGAPVEDGQAGEAVGSADGVGSVGDDEAAFRAAGEEDDEAEADTPGERCGQTGLCDEVEIQKDRYECCVERCRAMMVFSIIIAMPMDQPIKARMRGQRPERPRCVSRTATVRR